MSNIIRWDPMREMLNMREAMDSVFDDFFRKGPVEYKGMGVFDLDMFQTADKIFIKACLPGVKNDDIKINMTDNILTISGETKEESEEKDMQYHIRERRFGSFTRSIELPTRVIAEKATAEFADGVLTLTLPKAEEVKPKTITVKAK